MLPPDIPRYPVYAGSTWRTTRRSIADGVAGVSGCGGGGRRVQAWGGQSARVDKLTGLFAHTLAAEEETRGVCL